MKVLTLSPSYEPLGVVDWEKAISLLYNGKVHVLSEYERLISSPSTQIRVPSVIVFKNGKRHKKNSVRFSRKNIWIRDEGRCQYCGLDVSIKDFTIDHVIPKTLGGGTMWTNVVTCCATCNQKKGDKLAHRCGMSLKSIPVKPSSLPFVQDSEHYFNNSNRIPDDWKFWLGEIK